MFYTAQVRRASRRAGGRVVLATVISDAYDPTRWFIGVLYVDGDCYVYRHALYNADDARVVVRQGDRTEDARGYGEMIVHLTEVFRSPLREV